ncbi:acetyltransferase (GNAT) family protein [Larkinella arboricola]|uniref:Acetyltransferase (GNAT) family protein n=1 Tax=Larkinella arboricola TaxID=643671 RepID=A0A327XBP9_LARAB|nr:GNAT family N-acetyltransferase [Larkinella arboricola]RAK03052.1 acetyltransferase (GNAT) family protein [Larkinella arboricola]
MVRYLSRNQIDVTAYDRCIAYSPQRLIYAFSWYLDVVTPGWELLVEGDYERVMPLPVRWRYGVKAVIQPLFCHQLGVFALHETPDATVLTRFLHTLYQHVRYIPSYQFQAANMPGLTAEAGQLIPMTNHVLNLQKPYTELAAGYSKGQKWNLRHGLRQNWEFTETDDIAPLIGLFRTYNTGGIGRVASDAYAKLQRLVAVLQERQQVRIRVAQRNGRVEAGNLLVTDVNRVIHLFCSASPEGRKGSARTVILDQFIREYAGQSIWFDFESPEVDSLAAFNRGFGAGPEPYVRLVSNRLPGPMRFLHQIKKRLHQTLLLR